MLADELDFVLIESDWNLKDTADGTYTGWYNVLIESDWNLKESGGRMVKRKY